MFIFNVLNIGHSDIKDGCPQQLIKHLNQTLTNY